MIGDVFTAVLLDPMINFLVILNNLSFGSFGIALILFTLAGLHYQNIAVLLIWSRIKQRQSLKTRLP